VSSIVVLIRDLREPLAISPLPAQGQCDMQARHHHDNSWIDQAGALPLRRTAAYGAGDARTVSPSF
jgi:hypothetical protein